MRLENIVSVRNGFFCVPAVTMRKDARTIVLVGVVHIGLIPYFERTQSLLDALERGGYHITHEFFDWLRHPPRLWRFDPRLERVAEEVKLEVESVLRERFHFGTQMTYIKPRLSWVFFDPRPMNETAEGVLSAEKFIDQGREFLLAPAKFMQTQFADSIREMANSRKFRPKGLKHTDRKVAQNILTHARYTNVAACWGAGHLPNLRRRLRDRGYVISSIEWLPFCPTKF